MQKFANNVETKVALDASAADTIIAVDSVNGFPDVSAPDDYFLATIAQIYEGRERFFEIVECFSVDSGNNTVSVKRGQEGTAARDISKGEVFSLRVTAQSMDNKEAALGNPAEDDQILSSKADGTRSWVDKEGTPTLAIGRINNPLVHIPLKNSLDMVCGKGTVTFTRASSATYIDRYGVVQKVASDVARFESDGLLMEGASTNKLTYSEEFDNSAWNKQRCTISANATTAPDGTTTADGIVANTDNSNHPVVYGNLSTTSNTISFSAHCARGNKDYFQVVVRFQDSSGNTLEYVTFGFDLVNGLTGTLPTDGDSQHIDELDNDWWRLKCTTTYSGTGTVGKVTVYLYPAESFTDITFPGDGSTINTYVWGAQLEEFPHCTSYIPSGSAATTRAADKCSIDYDENVPEGDQDVSIISDFKLNGYTTTHQELFRDTSVYAALAQVGTGGSCISHAWGGGSINSYTHQIAINTLYRAVFVVGDNMKLFLDGELKASLSRSTGKNTHSFYIGSLDGSFPLCGHISNFRIWDVALTDEEVRVS